MAQQKLTIGANVRIGKTQLANLKLINEIKKLCTEFKYDEAIRLTNQISDKLIATKAHLLCMEHEECMRKAGRLPKEEAAPNAT